MEGMRDHHLWNGQWWYRLWSCLS